jgi:hypothetical protein
VSDTPLMKSLHEEIADGVGHEDLRATFARLRLPA